MLICPKIRTFILNFISFILIFKFKNIRIQTHILLVCPKESTYIHSVIYIFFYQDSKKENCSNSNKGDLSENFTFFWPFQGWEKCLPFRFFSPSLVRLVCSVWKSKSMCRTCSVLFAWYNKAYILAFGTNRCLAWWFARIKISQRQQDQFTTTHIILILTIFLRPICSNRLRHFFA